jgi:hypothetical protein
VSDTLPATLPELPVGVVLPAGIDERAGRAILVALVHGFGWAHAVWDRQCIDELPDEFDLRLPTEGGTYCARGGASWWRLYQPRHEPLQWWRLLSGLPSRPSGCW